MPLALLLLGILFLTAAARGNKCDNQQCADLLFTTIKSDFTGPGNFIYWGIALFIIGAAGYYKPFKPLSNAFLFLVILVLFLSNRGFFVRFMEQIGSTQSANSNLGSGSNSTNSMSSDPIGAAINNLLSGDPISKILGVKF